MRITDVHPIRAGLKAIEFVFYGAVAMVLIGTFIAVTFYSVAGFDLPSASTGFTNGYTDSGGCLHDTPYDPANGAKIHTDVINNMTIVTVVPANTSDSTYPTLSLRMQLVDKVWVLQPDNGAAFESVVGSPLCVNKPSISK